MCQTNWTYLSKLCLLKKLPQFFYREDLRRWLVFIPLDHRSKTTSLQKWQDNWMQKNKLCDIRRVLFDMSSVCRYSFNDFIMIVFVLEIQVALSTHVYILDEGTMSITFYNIINISLSRISIDFTSLLGKEYLTRRKQLNFISFWWFPPVFITLRHGFSFSNLIFVTFDHLKIWLKHSFIFANIIQTVRCTTKIEWGSDFDRVYVHEIIANLFQNRLFSLINWHFRTAVYQCVLRYLTECLTSVFVCLSNLNLQDTVCRCLSVWLSFSVSFDSVSSVNVQSCSSCLSTCHTHCFRLLSFRFFLSVLILPLRFDSKLMRSCGETFDSVRIVDTVIISIHLL